VLNIICPSRKPVHACKALNRKDLQYCREMIGRTEPPTA
jgi:hypothetical protein